MADMVRALVWLPVLMLQTESEVIREGLRALNERDKAIEAVWNAFQPPPLLDSIRKPQTVARSFPGSRPPFDPEVICITYEVIIT
ncbi:hypothetical protein ACLBOM_23465 [Escherichia coli]